MQQQHDDGNNMNHDRSPTKALPLNHSDDMQAKGKRTKDTNVNVNVNAAAAADAAASDDAGAGAGGTTGENTAAASDLDHVLLESLFYNEMVMLETTPASPVPGSNFYLPKIEHDTPHTIVEKEILRDFGVGVGSLCPSTNGSSFGQFSTAPLPDAIRTASTAPTPSARACSQICSEKNITNNHPHKLSHFVQQYNTVYQQQQGNKQGANHSQHQRLCSDSPPLSSTTINQLGTNFNNTQQVIPARGNTPQNKSSTMTVIEQPHHPELLMDCTESQASTSTAVAASANNISSEFLYSSSTSTKPFPRSLPPHSERIINSSTSSGNSQIGSVPQDRARQLVDQFATLASRLGIDLPDSVLQSLTSAAAKKEEKMVANQAVTSTGLSDLSDINNPSTSVKTLLGGTNKKVINDDKNIVTLAPTIMELRKTAEESIAAVTRKREDHLTKISKKKSDEKRKGIKLESAPVSATDILVTNDNNSTINDSKPTYSKRRKKPRLSECETKLAQLKAENEQLKRHLQNVSNKAHKFDMEKEEAGKNIARLIHDPNAGPHEMEMSVSKFSDMYSDYGINRQQELSFHLEQLQRLVNPADSTKMGLWTLGQSNRGTKKNPIAGILVKELDITPQQGRKILDQSEKIRKLCDNLKEAHSLLVKLKILCEKKTRCFQDRMSKCTEILTSKQVARLIIWINEHTQLLEKVCPGWGTEHIPKHTT